MTTEEMIRKIVKQTIAELRASDMIRTSGKTEEEKTEELLRHYNYFLASKKPELIKVVGEIDDALRAIENDPFYPLIPMYYFSGESREDIANHFEVSVRTVSRQKRRLIRILSNILFPRGAG